MKQYLLFVPLSLALGLSACSGGSISPSGAQTISDVLAVGCPIATAASVLKLNKTEAAALKTLQLACPPNPPPTNEATVIADVVQAYTILQPLIK